MHSKLVDAIRNKKALSISYDGGTKTLGRIRIGIGRNGQPLLRCYQSSGYSSSGNPSGLLKLMRVEKVRNLCPTPDTSSRSRGLDTTRTAQSHSRRLRHALMRAELSAIACSAV